MAGSSAEVGQLLTTAEEHCDGWWKGHYSSSDPPPACWVCFHSRCWWMGGLQKEVIGSRKGKVWEGLCQKLPNCVMNLSLLDTDRQICLAGGNKAPWISSIFVATFRCKLCDTHNSLLVVFNIFLSLELR